MTQSVELEARQELADVMLAQVTGWVGVTRINSRLWGFHKSQKGIQPMPRPCLDWALCGPLLTEHHMAADYDPTTDYVTVQWRSTDGVIRLEHVPLTDDITADALMRFTIVVAAYKQVRCRQQHADVIRDRYIAALQTPA